MPNDDKSSHGFWPGELKICKTGMTYINVLDADA